MARVGLGTPKMKPATYYLHFGDCIMENEFENSESCCRQVGMVAGLRTWQEWGEKWMNSGGTLERKATGLSH